MNRQEVKKEALRNERPIISNQPPKGGAKKQNTQLLELLRGCMVILAGMIVVVGLLLIILPMFRVKTIKVEGNSYYTAEQIIEATGIEIGQEMVTVSKGQMTEGIWKDCKYVDEVSIGKYFFSVKIKVTERKNVMYTEFNGKYIALDQSFKALGESENEADFEGFLKVTLPEIASLSIGGQINFEKDEMDLSYISQLFDTLEKEGKLESVSSMDLSKKFSVSFVMENACRVKIGKVSDMSAKLRMVDEILQVKGGVFAALSEVDVSDLQKPTYRVLSSADMLLG